MSAETPLTVKAARALLGVGPLAGPGEIRRAFREAAKQAHPDRPGGDEKRFRQVMAAYQRLQPGARDDRFFQPPAPAPAQPAVLALDPLVALRGGSVEHALPSGRRIRLKLPAGLRHGDVVRAGEAELTVALRGDPEMLVRGDDLWITVRVPPRALNAGGRVALETPIGRRIIWLTKEAAQRGLVRLVGQGLPARGARAQGHLFLRLSAAEGEAGSAARALLRRFTAAWAA